jgi:hypothetical protein
MEQEPIHVAPITACFDYDCYNREERYTCSHLFRLLHEPAGEYMTLRRFIGDIPEIGPFRIFTEVALLRDAYHERKTRPNEFMDALVDIVAKQQECHEYSSYSQLDKELNNPRLTHPRQIFLKGQHILTPGEKKIYGAIQGMFN